MHECLSMLKKNRSMLYLYSDNNDAKSNIVYYRINNLMTCFCGKKVQLWKMFQNDDHIDVKKQNYNSN